jgi:MFS family permease
VNSKMAAAMALAVPLLLVGLYSAWQQIRGLRHLRERKLVPSDEAAYLRGRHRRRLVVGVLLVLIGGLIAGAFLSGMEARADELGEKKPTDANGEKKEMTDEEKQFVWRWGLYWIAVVLPLTFALIGLAIADGLASRRYWLKLYREMRDEHNSQLRRDLAVYMQQKEQGRGGGGFGGRMGGGN